MKKLSLGEKGQNVILKFREFWNTLNTDEKEQLYVVLSAIRGGDYTTDMSDFWLYDELKESGTKRIRRILNVVVDSKLKPLTNTQKIRRVSLLKNKQISEHYRSHLIVALRTLRGLGFKGV